MTEDVRQPVVTSQQSSVTLAKESAELIIKAPVQLARLSACELFRSVALNRERCKAILLDTTYQVRHQVLCNFRDLFKSSFTQDPSVPKVVSKYAEAIIDTLWKDIEDEIERDLEACLLEQQAREEAEGPEGWWLFAGILRFRALFLHHYLPHDKSFWGKKKDPIHLVIFFLMLTPSSVLHFCLASALLLMIVLPGPPDEFQLLNFIMQFKGLQFVSSGVLKCVKVSLVEFVCYSVGKDELLHCISTWGPPSATTLDLMLDYMGTIFLTWFAASMLPRSKPHARPRYQVRSEYEANQRKAGHRLHNLLHYDMMCFALSLILLLIATVCLCDRIDPVTLLSDPQFSVNIFWCAIFWSLSTFPFLPLNISWLFVALSRSTPTGFNDKGACVRFEVSWKERPKASFPGYTTMTQAFQIVKEAAVGRRRPRDLEDGAEQREPVGYVRAAAEATCDLYYAAKQRTLEGDNTSGLVVDMVPAPDQLMVVWDRY